MSLRSPPARLLLPIATVEKVDAAERSRLSRADGGCGQDALEGACAAYDSRTPASNGGSTRSSHSSRQ